MSGGDLSSFEARYSFVSAAWSIFWIFSFYVFEFRFDFGLHLRIRKGFEFPRKPTSKIED